MISSTQFHKGAQVTIGWSEIAQEFICLSYHRSECFDIGVYKNKETFDQLTRQAIDEINICYQPLNKGLVK